MRNFAPCDCPVCKPGSRTPQYECARDPAPPSVPPPDAALTPSEVFLARVFAAWEAWPGTSLRSGVRSESTVVDIGTLLVDAKWATAENRLTPEAEALLERARKAGVLW